MDTKSEMDTMHGTYKSYAIGFVLSLVLTFAMYFLVVEKAFTGFFQEITLATLALAQVLVQLVFFLHLGKESKPYWNLIVFLFMALVVGIIVLGSLWIMYNLDYRTMHDMHKM